MANPPIPVKPVGTSAAEYAKLFVEKDTSEEHTAMSWQPELDELKRRIEAKLDSPLSPFRTAEAFGIEEIIDPRDTRPLLCDWIQTAYDILPSQLGPKTRGFRP